MSDSNSTRNARRDLYAIFDKVLTTYTDTLLTPYEKTFSFEGKSSPTLAPGSNSLHYKADVEIAVRRVLTEPEELQEWDRLVRIEYARQIGQEPDSKPTPPTKQQRELTHSVVDAMAKISKRRGLDSPSYWVHVKRRA